MENNNYNYNYQHPEKDDSGNDENVDQIVQLQDNQENQDNQDNQSDIQISKSPSIPETELGDKKAEVKKDVEVIQNTFTSISPLPSDLKLEEGRTSLPPSYIDNDCLIISLLSYKEHMFKILFTHIYRKYFIILSFYYL